MKYLKFCALIVAISLVLSACGKSTVVNKELTLPPATQIGANTMGALVDGKPWAGVTYYGK